MLLEDPQKVTLHDVAAYFSEEEWKLLQEWQRELYKNVMNEIHQALISLGPLIASSVYSLRVKGKEDLCHVDKRDHERSHRGCPSASATEVISVVIKDEDVEDKENAETRKNMTSPTAPDPVITSVFSLSEKPRNEINFQEEPEPEEENMADPVITFVCSLSNEPEDEMNFQEEPKCQTMAGGMMIRNVSNEDSMHCVETKAPGKDSLEKEKVTVFEISHKGTYSSSPLFSEMNENLTKINIQSESSFSKALKLKSNQESSKSRRKTNLMKYQRTRTGPRSYQCTECGKAFTCTTHLVRHQTKHTGEKPYQCDECEKSFTQKGSLTIHQRIHSGETPYPCLECGTSFREKKHLVGHIKKFHTS
ncbi:zinc finger protein 583-like isoform X2 [Pleurodeles waltl]|uniref:zinc finger protein 583-like isoform X2 n=1 Tax=Pleurodeles waltl TaxID=8319 RepID=UPI003709A7F3